MSWVLSHQFERLVVGLHACGLRDTGFWNALVREMERKLMAFTAGQLANMVASLAAAGYVPSKNWLERTARQAHKHLHKSAQVGLPAGIASLLWASGHTRHGATVAAVQHVGCWAVEHHSA
jgi:hypothetical protein